MDTQDYKSDKCAVAYLSDLSSADAETLVGKQVSRVEAGEHILVMYFDDGSTLTVNGATRDDSPLGIELERSTKLGVLLECDKTGHWRRVST